MRNAWFGLALVVVACSSHQDAEPWTWKPPQTRALMKAKRSAPQREPIAPWSLTASDGSGLQLVSVDARAVIEGPLAFTELHLKFKNAEPRDREGTFSITLPPRAAVSRFAMLEDDRYKEAEVVAKALARRAYDDVLHRRHRPRDPREGRRQPVHREGLSDRGKQRQADRPVLQPGADRARATCCRSRVADDRQRLGLAHRR